MTTLIRITDDTTITELLECLALMSRTADTEGRTRRIGALLDELLSRKETSCIPS